jgi:hypothetical protein
VYSFECVCNVLPIENSLRDQSQMRSVLWGSNIFYGSPSSWLLHGCRGRSIVVI